MEGAEHRQVCALSSDESEDVSQPRRKGIPAEVTPGAKVWRCECHRAGSSKQAGDQGIRDTQWAMGDDWRWRRAEILRDSNNMGSSGSTPMRTLQSPKVTVTIHHWQEQRSAKSLTVQWDTN